MHRMLTIGLLVLAVSSCDKAEYETEQVTVSTPEGPVTCQLYRRDIVMWDEALTRPGSLTDHQANEACRIEGLREKEGAPVVTGTSEPDPVMTDEPPL